MSNNVNLKMRIKNKHDIPANWANATFAPMAGEIIVYDDHYFDDDGNKVVVADAVRFKIGDGVTPINDLPFVSDTEELKAEIAPLDDVDIDNLWVDVPGTNALPNFTMTTGFVPMWNGATFEDGIALDDITADQKYDETSTKPQSGAAIAEALESVKSQTVHFGYDSYNANDKLLIKRNGYYMMYCNNPKLKVMEPLDDGEFVEVIKDSKQIVMMASPITRKPDAITFGVAGTAWNGDSLSIMNLANLPVDGFRTSLREGSYITCDEQFWVYQMTKGALAELITTKILFIGNSHSQDTFMPLAEVFNAEGKNNFVFGVCKKEGGSVQDHASNIRNSVADYHYYESTPNDKGTYSNPFGRDDDGKLTRVTMDKVLTAQKWDYVFIQSCPGDYLDDTVFASDRDVVENYVKQYLPEAKICYSGSWLAPYSDDITKLQSLTGTNKQWYEANVAKGGVETAGQYRVIYDAVNQNLIPDTSYALVADVCTPVYYANQILGVGSDSLYRDTLHMGTLGRILVGYAFYTQFMKAFEGLTSFNSISLDKYVLGNYELTAEDKAMMLESVNYTLQNPWVMPTQGN